MICLVEGESSWMDLIIQFKLTGKLPTDPVTSKKLRRQGAMFVMMDGELYRRSFSAPLLKCINREDAAYVLSSIHEGICGHHIRGKTLAHKALRAGYYWPTALSDAKKLTAKCRKCQLHAPAIHAPARDLQPVLNPIPFAQ